MKKTLDLLQNIEEVEPPPFFEQRIMAAIRDWLRANVPETGYVSLLADGDAQRLYAQFGFVLTAPASVGMRYQPDAE